MPEIGAKIGDLKVGQTLKQANFLLVNPNEGKLHISFVRQLFVSRGCVSLIVISRNEVLYPACFSGIIYSPLPCCVELEAGNLPHIEFVSLFCPSKMSVWLCVIIVDMLNIINNSNHKSRPHSLINMLHAALHVAGSRPCTAG